MELVDADVAAQVANGMKEDVAFELIAKAIGLKTGSSLQTAYRYDHRRIPKRRIIELAAGRWRVPQSEIYGQVEPPSEAYRARTWLVSRGMGSDEVDKCNDEEVIEAERVALATAKAMLAK